MHAFVFTPKSKPPLRSGTCRRRGFALLITVTLLAFLVLLLVSLAALTRVETQVAANNQQLAQARQNALMALNIAVGQLQKYAGPDQRTTARADLDPTLAAATTANGRWTGVYGSRVAPDYEDKPNEIADKLKAVYDDALSTNDALGKKGSQAILLNWLVSGNEATDFNPLSDVATDGHISRTGTPDIIRKPADTGIDLAAIPSAPAAAATHALLVGPHSVTAVSDRVAAPLVPISVPENTLPGLDPASTAMQSIGRYAWWVGDENTKARINLPLDTTTTPADIAFVTAQRAGVELIDGFNPTGSVPSTGINTAHLLGHNDAYLPTASGIRSLLNAVQLPMLSAANAMALDAARRHRFHDLTATSLSVLADPYAGGLKKDLSAILAAGAPAPLDGAQIFIPHDSTVANVRPVPTWGMLRRHVQTTVALDESTPSGLQALEPRRPISGSDPGLFPVITFAEIRMEYFNSGSDVRLALIPRLVLWNPYSMPIKAKAAGNGGDFEFGINSIGNGWKLLGSVDDGGTSVTLDSGRGLNNGVIKLQGSSGNYTYLRFVIDLEEVDIPPGESHIFTVQESEIGKAYALSSSNYGTTKPGNKLTRGIDHGYILLPDTFPLTDAGGSPYKFRVEATDGFSKNSACYLGEIASAGPVTVDWDWNSPSASKPWYQSASGLGLSGGGAANAITNLQPEDSSWTDLAAQPGDNTWGVQIRHRFGHRDRWIANRNPRSNSGALAAIYMGTKVNDNMFNMSSVAATEHRASAANLSSLAVTADVPQDAVLFEFRPAGQPLLSIGQLQHANLSAFYRASTCYAIGNSACPDNILGSESTRWQLYNNASDGRNYDYAYLLNRALWDRYFVSTVPHDGTNAVGVTTLPDVLPNARHLRPGRGLAGEPSDLADADKAAARLLLAGGFNINSTSEQAWRAVLAGLNQLSHEPAGTLDSPLDSAFPRFARPSAAMARDGTTPAWAFQGYRRLDAEQISRLAANIVGEVRNRGPFVSLHDFINRRLWDNPSTVDGAKYPDPANPGSYIATTVKFNANETIKGTLQDAIDATPNTGQGSLNNTHAVTPFTRSISNISSNDNVAMRAAATQHAPVSSPDAYAAQFLTQADLLSAIGPGLAARSDTFTIRAYGDVRNPLTAGIGGRAWCEAVVQRTVEPVNRKSSDSSSPDYNEPAVATAGAADFGRRFRVISFRWLSSDDL